MPLRTPDARIENIMTAHSRMRVIVQYTHTPPSYNVHPREQGLPETSAKGWWYVVYDLNPCAVCVDGDGMTPDEDANPRTSLGPRVVLRPMSSTALKVRQINWPHAGEEVFLTDDAYITRFLDKDA